MKHLILYIAFAVSVIFMQNMTGDIIPAAQSVDNEKVLADDSTAREELTVLLSANSVADISLQQNNSSNGHNSLRRYSQERSFQSKIFVHLSERYIYTTTHLYKACFYSCREYFARQKIAGYYIYSLCKIII